MKLNALLAMCVCLAFAPVAVSAQGAPSNGPPPSQEMQQARDNAKTAAMNDLTPDHRTAVQGIVQKFDAGSVTMSDAATQIDSLLTPNESQAVLSEAQKYREARQQAFAQGGGPPQGMGGQPGLGPGSHHGGHKPDAARFLLMVSASPDALRREFSGGPP